MTLASVVVTFNRKQLLIETLNALIQQSTPLVTIYIIDNQSTDGTPDYLHTHGFIDKCTDFSKKMVKPPTFIYYVRLTANIGGAGGFHEGLKLAQADGHDWIWLLDDDACPELHALAYLLKYADFETNLVALAGSVWGTDQTLQLPHRGHFQRRRFYPYLHTPLAETFYQQETIFVDMASFVGLLVKRTAIEKIGLPKREFFIHHDDVDYCLRLRTIGKILLVPASKIIHKDSVTRQGEHHFLGRPSRRIPLQRLWLFYFSVRNAIYLGKHQLPRLSFVAQAARYFLRLLMGIIIYDEFKMQRIRCLYRAFKDGILENFANSYPFQLKRTFEQEFIQHQDPKIKR